MSATAGWSRLRSYIEFIAAILYFFVARSFAHRAALRVQNDAWAPLVEQFLLAALLILGYAAFGSLFDRQARSISAQGLPLRAGWPGEAALGVAIGWGAVVVCVLPMAVLGGIAVIVSTQRASWGW